MNLLGWLIPLALGMGITGLIAFLWSMKSGQLEDLDGAGARVLLHEADDVPLQDADRRHPGSTTKRETRQ